MPIIRKLSANSQPARLTIWTKLPSIEFWKYLKPLTKLTTNKTFLRRCLLTCPLKSNNLRELRVFTTLLISIPSMLRMVSPKTMKTSTTITTILEWTIISELLILIYSNNQIWKSWMINKVVDNSIATSITTIIITSTNHLLKILATITSSRILSNNLNRANLNNLLLLITLVLLILTTL